MVTGFLDKTKISSDIFFPNRPHISSRLYIPERSGSVATESSCHSGWSWRASSRSWWSWRASCYSGWSWRGFCRPIDSPEKPLAFKMPYGNRRLAKFHTISFSKFNWLYLLNKYLTVGIRNPTIQNPDFCISDFKWSGFCSFGLCHKCHPFLQYLILSTEAGNACYKVNNLFEYNHGCLFL